MAGTGALGLTVLTAAVLLRAKAASGAPCWLAPSFLAAALLGVVSAVGLVRSQNWTELAVLAALAAVCSAVVSLVDRGLRAPAAALAVLLPGVMLVLLVADGLAADLAGWILAVLAAGALGLAALRLHEVEERPVAAAAFVLGLLAIPLTASTYSWGQVALQLSVSAAVLLAYGRAAGRRPETLVALAELVTASWVGAAGLAVATPEVYTLPVVAGLLLASGRALLSAPSWSVWGAPLLVGLVPSTLLVVDTPDAVRLVLLVSLATGCVVAGTLTHRQAPFVIGLGVLHVLALTQLGPYATLLPRWLSLGAAGVTLLVLGASYERRLAQAREAVSWVGALR